MKTLRKRILAIFMATIMCVATGVTASAAEPGDMEATRYDLEVSSEGIVSCTDENGNSVSNISPRSTISGYTNGTVNRNNPMLVLYPDVATGIGGMGVTIKTSSSWKGNFNVTIGAHYVSGMNTVLQNASISSNAENYFEDLMHRAPGYLVFTFGNIPVNTNVKVEI